MNSKSRYFEALAVAVASGSTIRDAAIAAKCSESTAYRQAQSKEFEQRVGVIRAELTYAAVGRLAALASQAVDTLALLLDESQEPATRLNAAKSILGQLVPLSERFRFHSQRDADEFLELMKSLKPQKPSENNGASPATKKRWPIPDNLGVPK